MSGLDPSMDAHRQRDAVTHLPAELEADGYRDMEVDLPFPDPDVAGRRKCGPRLSDTLPVDSLGKKRKSCDFGL